jgi:hypothetical protein
MRRSSLRWSKRERRWSSRIERLRAAARGAPPRAWIRGRMRVSSICCGLAVGLLIGPPLLDCAGARIGAGSASAAERQAKPRKPHAERPARPRADRPGFLKPGDPRFAYAPGFVFPLHERPAARMSFMRNPLVSAEYRATPEYNYLYMASPVVGSPPNLPPRRYAADNSYLLRRPSPGPIDGTTARRSRRRATPPVWRSARTAARPAAPTSRRSGAGASRGSTTR